MGAFEKLLTALESVENIDLSSPKLDPSWNKNLHESLEQFLRNIMDHFDDCESIVKGFIPKGRKRAEVPQISAYNKAIQFYRTHIGKIVNHIKHKQGRIRSIALFKNSSTHLGYFVEGPAENGSLGPAPHIHKGGDTAFSFNRDVRLHFHGLYYVSQQVAKTVSDIGNVDFSTVELEISGDSRYKEIVYRIERLGLFVYTDEARKNFPFVAIETAESGDYSLVTSLKRQPYGLREIQSPYRVVTFYRTDGVTRGFGLPYENN